ncbi:MAG: hypothetical protein O3C40_07390 [Planctomycetota bacterium]|nr:hypothetical protein [Planctomycetota bacterium]
MYRFENVVLRTLLLATALVAINLASRGWSQEASNPFVDDVFENGGIDSGGVEVEFPHAEPPLWCELLEAGPTVLSWPDEPLGNFFGHVLGVEHLHIESAIEEHAIGIQPLPPRPPLIVEWNELFLGPGSLAQGIEIPTGAVWRPAFWVFGEYRGAMQYFDRGDPIAEWANRLDLFGQLNLSGTERLLVGVRPLDEETSGRRDFTGYDFNDGNWTDGTNAKMQTLFFEGDFGELFPNLDPYDTRMLDYGFSIGRMPLLAQQGLLINEDMIDAVTVTRNTLSGHGNLNLRATGVYSWRGINRNSPVGRPNDFDPNSKMVAILTESDFAKRTVNLDATYVYGDPTFGNMYAFAASSIRRHHGHHNTYNTSVHLLASIPEGPTTPYADQGELLFAQTSWTPHHTDDLIYVNAFWAIDQFTSPTRGPLMGSPLGQTGILFASVALGQYTAPIAVRTDNLAGASLGYQLFFNNTRDQLIFELGGAKETKGVNRGTLGTGLRYQKAIGQHSILVVEGFVSKHEGQRVSQGARTEWRIKF